MMEPRSVLDRVCCLRARSLAAFSMDSNELLDVKTNEFFFAGALGIYIRRGDTSAICDRSQTTWLEYEILRGI